jgi:hypothetical protein
MTDRISHTTVTFAHPFELPGMDGVQPPGLYDIETVETELLSNSVIGYRRVSTTIVPRATGTSSRLRQLSNIDPLDLAAALARDAAQPVR